MRTKNAAYASADDCAKIYVRDVSALRSVR